MQRRILEEQVHQEPAVDQAVNPVARFDNILQRRLVGKDDQGAGLAFRHGPAGLRNLLDHFAVHPFFADSQKLTEEGLACPGQSVGPQAVEEMTDFRLENHNERQHAHVDERAQQGAHQFHVEGCHDHPQEEQGHQGDENVHRRRAPDPPEGQVDDAGHHEDIQDICGRHVHKTENFQQHTRNQSATTKITIFFDIGECSTRFPPKHVL